MDSSQTKKYQPSDLVVYKDDEITGSMTLYHVDLLGEDADKIFGRANEALRRKDQGWRKKFEQAAEEFKKIAGFRPEDVYQAEVELRMRKGLGQKVDRQCRPLFEGLNMSPELKTKER